MSEKRAVAIYSGVPEELHTGDTLYGAAPASPLTTKGDLYTFAAADARLPVGIDGQVLSADSGESTGLKWASLPSPWSVAAGGTGASSLTAYAVVCGGTTSTGGVQPIASVGTVGQVLTSNGAGALPTFQAAALSDASVSQAKLKTSTGENVVNTGNTNIAFLVYSGNFVRIPGPGSSYTSRLSFLYGGTTVSQQTLPGGEYGFWPQIKNYNVSLTYYMASQQRYVSASGPDHWIFFLVAKKDFDDGELGRKKGDILAGYQAPDHPSANTQSRWTDLQHPFLSYDPSLHEIIIIDNSILQEVKSKNLVKRNKSLMQVITGDFVIDDTKRPRWAERRIHKVNEFPDEPIGRKLSSIYVPEWFSAFSSAEAISFEEEVVEKLPPHIFYKQMVAKK